MVKKRKQADNRRPFYIAVIAIIVVGAVALSWKASRSGVKAEVVEVPHTLADAQGYLYGNANAPVQILEWGDFECPGCAQFATVTEPDVRKRLVDTGLASYRFFDLPLSMHRNTMVASNAAACASDQNKFWEMHDRIFNGQGDWNSESTDNPRKFMRGYAKDLGLDLGQWDQCMDARKHEARILANRDEGIKRGVNQTPTFFVGNRKLTGSVAYDAIKAYVDTALVDAKKTAPADSLKAGDSATRLPLKAAAKDSAR